MVELYPKLLNGLEIPADWALCVVVVIFNEKVE